MYLRFNAQIIYIIKIIANYDYPYNISIEQGRLDRECKWGFAGGPMGPFLNLGKVFRVNEESVEPSELRERVREVYSKAATDPGGEHPFPLGRDFALEVGYPVDLLTSFPETATESFAGVSNVSIYAELPEGSKVLDIGCGAGLDCLVAAGKVGSSGRVVGVDFSHKMIDKAKNNTSLVTRADLEFRVAAAESLPFPHHEFDVVMVNGIFNLNPFRNKIYDEIYRVLKPGGHVYASELVLGCKINDRKSDDFDDWFT